jgi:hypothetical protein
MGKGFLLTQNDPMEHLCRTYAAASLLNCHPSAGACSRFTDVSPTFHRRFTEAAHLEDTVFHGIRPDIWGFQ